MFQEEREVISRTQLNEHFDFVVFDDMSVGIQSRNAGHDEVPLSIKDAQTLSTLLQQHLQKATVPPVNVQSILDELNSYQGGTPAKLKQLVLRNQKTLGNLGWRLILDASPNGGYKAFPITKEFGTLYNRDGQVIETTIFFADGEVIQLSFNGQMLTNGGQTYEAVRAQFDCEYPENWITQIAEEVALTYAVNYGNGNFYTESTDYELDADIIRLAGAMLTFYSIHFGINRLKQIISEEQP